MHGTAALRELPHECIVDPRCVVAHAKRVTAARVFREQHEKDTRDRRGYVLVRLTSISVAQSSLLAIDDHRPTVVDRIVMQWGDALATWSTRLNRAIAQMVMFNLMS